MWSIGQRDGDVIVGTDGSIDKDDAHDAGFPDQVSIGIAVEDSGQQVRLKAVELRTRVS